MGRVILYGTLGNGGTAYFAAKSDLSTLLQDLRLVRPTELNFVPRIWETLFSEFQREVDRRLATMRTRNESEEEAGNSTGLSDPTDPAARKAVESEVLVEQRQYLLGGRCIVAMTGSAPISPELKAWVESLLEMHLTDGYGSTEAGMVLFDGEVQCPPVIDYKLVNVPDLGYFATDRPYPRGELLLKTENMFPGYYKRPEVTADVFDADGYYRTGDVVAEVGLDRLVYVDRRNNVLKLAQGEFVTLAKLEAVFGNSPLVRQIYVYGNSARPYLLAVAVPTEEALVTYDADGLATLKPLIADSLQNVAKEAGLQSYEVPRDFIIETTPFTLENGLLTGIGKLAWPKLKQHYGERLEQLYADLAEGQANELSELRHGGADAPILQTVSRAAAALLGTATTDLSPDAHFTDLGGDSLSALTFGNLLHEIFDIDVPVGVIVSPANDVQAIADYIEGERQGGKRPSFASVHGRDAVEVHASDLTLDKFIDAPTLAAAPTLRRPSAEVRTVLLTGATGFLGRYLALEWLERMDLVDGKVIALVRAKTDVEARARLDKTFDSGDPKLLAHYRELAAEHLEVIAGDKGEANLGLDEQTWQRLADTVDLVVDPAALVNHVLPYSELFGPNALGTAELIRIALTSKQKPYTFVSTIGVGDQIEPAKFTEDADIRVISPTRKINDSYANGYGKSKWAGEVLLREAHDLCGLPVAVFRCDMILADTTYAGQLNVPDMFTRMILSLVATGIAPGSFYELDADGNRQRAHTHNGLPVEFIAEAVSTLGARSVASFQAYHVMDPYDDGMGSTSSSTGSSTPAAPSSASVTTATGCGGSRPPCEPCPNGSATARYCRCCTTTRSPRSRSIGRWHRPIGSVQRSGTRKWARIKTCRTSRRRSSPSTSAICDCSDCSEAHTTTDIDLSALAAACDGSEPLRVTCRPHRPGVVMIRALLPVLGPSRRPTFRTLSCQHRCKPCGPSGDRLATRARQTPRSGHRCGSRRPPRPPRPGR